MKNLVNNKKYLTLILFGLLTLVIGISLTIIMFNLSGNDNSLKTGQIFMNYTEPSNEVVLKDQLPIADELGMNSDKYFEFSVMSNATTNENDKTGINIFYEISLSKKDVTQQLNQLEDNQIKIYLTKVVGEDEYVVLEPTLISKLEKSNYGETLKIYDTKNKHHSNIGTITTKYRLRFWIANEVDATNWYKENKYEYRFVVNVNGHAPNLDLVNDNTLATKIKTMYTVENGTAVEENGYYYLKGTEFLDLSNDPRSKVLSTFGELGNVYLYRQEIDNGNIKPVTNIKKITDTKEYTYNQEMIERDFKDYMMKYGDVTESEYNAMTAPFGGYLNLLLGNLSGVVTEDPDTYEFIYAEGKTIDDIPTLDVVMADDTLRPNLIEMMSDIIPEMMPNSKTSFLSIYSDGEKINQELLNENLRLGATSKVESDMISTIEDNFGSLSNFCIAEANKLIDYDNMTLIEGKTLDDIPTLESLFLNANIKEKVLLTNTYVELNNILWRVVGINSDDSVKLMSVYQVAFEDKESFETGNVSKFFGFNNNNSPFLTLLKDTTLEDIIIKTEYKYEEDGKEKKVLAYASMPTYEDIKNTVVDKKTYLLDFDNGQINTSVATKSSQSGYRWITMYSDEDLNENEGNSNYISFNPVITIENIEVIGAGTRRNPYKIKNEKIVTEENFVTSIKKLKLDVFLLSSINLYENMGFNYERFFDSDNYFEGLYSIGISVNNKCYYETVDGYHETVEYYGPCAEKYVHIKSEPNSTIDTYSFNETTLSLTATNADEYQWQQKIGEEWIDLEDYSGRISGTKTNTLTIIPTSYFSKKNYFRCIVKNKISKTFSNEYTVNMTLTDGEFVYQEIDDTNKYEIINYIGDYTNSIHMTINEEDNTKYDLTIPSSINGDVITKVSKVNDYESTWNADKIKTITLSNGIKEINCNVSSNALTDIYLNEDLEVIGNSAFKSALLNKIVIPANVLKIGDSAFQNSPATKIIFNDKLQEIGDLAFYSAQVEEFESPDSIKKIGKYSFAYAPIKEIALNEGLEIIDEGAFFKSPLTKLKIPSTVVTIGTVAFQDAKLTELEVPSSVKIIGEYTFALSEITNLVLHEGIEEIGNAAFRKSKITELELPKSMKTIGAFAFLQSPLTKLTLNEGLEIVGSSAFESAKVTELEIPGSIKEIYSQAFRGIRLTSLKLNEGTKRIEAHAFESAQLTSLSIPSSVTYVHTLAFLNSSFNDLKIYGKTSLTDFTDYIEGTFSMADGYEPQFIAGTLE